MKTVLFIGMLFTLSGCGFFAKKPAEDKNPLLTTECPAELPPIKEGATFGDSNLKLIEVAGIYHACRQAATAGVKR